MTVYQGWSATPTVPQPGETGTWIVRYRDDQVMSIHNVTVFAATAAHAAWEVAGQWNEGVIDYLTLIEVVPADEKEAQRLRRQLAS